MPTKIFCANIILLAVTLSLFLVNCKNNDRPDGTAPTTEQTPAATPTQKQKPVENVDRSTLKQLIVGREYSSSDVETGKLSLRDCGQGKLFQLSNAAPVQADTVDLANDQSFFVAGMIGDKCVLQQDSKPLAAINNEGNPTAALITGMTSYYDTNISPIGFALRVALAKLPEGSDAPHLYVTVDAGGSWHKMDAANLPAEGGSVDTAQRVTRSSASNQALLTLTINNHKWWSWNRMYAQIEKITIGQAFSIKNYGAYPFQLAMLENCDVQLIIRDDNNGKLTSIISDKGQAITKDMSITLYAIGTPRPNCQFKLKFNDDELAAEIDPPDSSEHYTIPASTTLSAKGGKIHISQGTGVPPTATSGSGFYVYVTGNGGKSWDYGDFNFFWGTAREYATSTAWNAEASMNQMLAFTNSDSASTRIHIKTGGN